MAGGPACCHCAGARVRLRRRIPRGEEADGPLGGSDEGGGGRPLAELGVIVAVLRREGYGAAAGGPRSGREERAGDIARRAAWAAVGSNPIRWIEEKGLAAAHPIQDVRGGRRGVHAVESGALVRPRAEVCGASAALRDARRCVGPVEAPRGRPRLRARSEACVDVGCR